MNIKERIQQDIVKLTVSEEIELLKLSLKEYMVSLNTYLVNQSGMCFDYYGGCFHNSDYFDFSKGFMILIDCGDKLTTVRVWCSGAFDATFKFYAKTNNLTYWDHSVKSLQAKEKIKELVKEINKRIVELK